MIKMILIMYICLCCIEVAQGQSRDSIITANNNRMYYFIENRFPINCPYHHLRRKHKPDKIQRDSINMLQLLKVCNYADTTDTIRLSDVKKIVNNSIAEVCLGFDARSVYLEFKKIGYLNIDFAVGFSGILLTFDWNFDRKRDRLKKAMRRSDEELSGACGIDPFYFRDKYLNLIPFKKVYFDYHYQFNKRSNKIIVKD